MLERLFNRACLLMLMATLAVPLCQAGGPAAPAKNAKDADPADAQRFWLQADYLLRWTSGNSLPPLVTASPAGTPLSLAGVLPGAQTLFGGNVDDEGRHGARLAFGYWFQNDRRYALEASVDWVGDNGGTRFAASSDGSSFLARPFLDANLNAPSAFLVSAPGFVSGAVSSSTSTQALSASAGLRKNWRRTGQWRIDLLGGYRYFQYRESLRVAQSSTVIGGGLLPLGTTVSGADGFSAKNDFHGGEVGLAAEWHHDRWSVSVTPKVALGVVLARSRINGDTSIAGGPPLVGDLLALSSNIGSRSDDSFAALPEARLVGGYAVSRHLGFTLGYDIRYLSSALRTSGQIDLTVNPNLVPPGAGGGPARPQPQMTTTGLWSHGLNAGLEFRF